MKFLKERNDFSYDLAIYGLGFESRSIALLDSDTTEETVKLAIGYSVNTDVLNYPDNKAAFVASNCKVIEGDDDSVFEKFESVFSRLNFETPVNVQLDITVMSRYRLASILCRLIKKLPSDSIVSVVYSRSSFVEPPSDSTPIRTIGELSDELIGDVGDLSLPTCAIFGLGYEPDKALGVSNYLDSNIVLAYVPKSDEERFETCVLENNEDFLSQLASTNIASYSVDMPYSTYVDLKSLIISLKEITRPILIPLGPKILSAIGAVIGLELQIPVWRVSSDHEERPVERPASGNIIRFDLSI